MMVKAVRVMLEPNNVIKFFRCFVKTSAVSGTDKNSE